MNVLITGDWQCSVSNLDRCKILVKQIIDILETQAQTRPRFVIHLGDLKEVFNPLDIRVTNFIIQAFTAIKKHCEGIYFVRGNHDPITTQDDVQSIIPLLQTLDIVTADSKWEYHELTEAVDLYMVPFFRDPVRQLKAFQDAHLHAHTNPKIKLLAFHNEMDGCEQNAYTKGKGLTLHDIRPSTYSFCVAGHIHRPQLYKNVWFAGSPFCQDWGEVNEDKRLLLIRVQDKRIHVKSIDSALPGWYDPDAPGFVKQSNWKDCRVRVRVPVRTDPSREITEARRKLEVKHPGAILHLIPEYETDSKVEKIDLRGGDDAVIERYLETLTMPAHVIPDQVHTYIKKFLPVFNQFGVQGLRFTDFEAYEVLPFEEVKGTFDKKGLTLITANNFDWGETQSNGGGKSSYVSIPFIAMFGKTVKEQLHDGWARDANEKPALVIQHVQLPDTRTLKLVRGRRPSKFRVWLEDSEITMGKPELTQALVEQLTNCTWEVITNAVYIGQDEIGSVFGTDKERKELFSRLLGLDRFITANEKLRKVLTRITRAAESTESEIAEAESAIREAQTNQGYIQKQLDQLPTLEKNVARTTASEIARLEALQKERERKLEVLQREFDKNQKEFETFLFSEHDYEAKYEQLEALYQQCTAIQGQCPSCGSETSVKSLEKYAKSLKRKMVLAQEQIDHFASLKTSNRTVRNAMSEARAKTSLEIRETTKQLSDSIRKQNVIEETLKSRKRLEDIVNQQEIRLRELLRVKTIHALARSFILEEQAFLETCVRAVGRDGLPSYLCAVAAPRLNAAATDYSELFSNGEIGLQFQISGGEIELQICNLHGSQTIKGQSKGEMRMAGIISAFAFRDALVGHNILILDEPGDGLDPTNAAIFAKALNKIKDRFEHILIISHNAHILANLEPDHHIKITKKNGVATVEES